MKQALQKYGEWIRWGMVMAAICGTQFMDLRFVAKAVYEKDKAGVDKSIVDMSTAIALLQANGKNLDDHEQRLRFLEGGRRKPNATLNYEIPHDDIFPEPDFRASN